RGEARRSSVPDAGGHAIAFALAALVYRQRQRQEQSARQQDDHDQQQKLLRGPAQQVGAEPSIVPAPAIQHGKAYPEVHPMPPCSKPWLDFAPAPSQLYFVAGAKDDVRIANVSAAQKPPVSVGFVQNPLRRCNTAAAARSTMAKFRSGTAVRSR